jgi:hypothetical protein
VITATNEVDEDRSRDEIDQRGGNDTRRIGEKISDIDGAVGRQRLGRFVNRRIDYGHEHHEGHLL